ncbi:MAG: methyltransferase domain-containing protein [Acidobacteriota bacterium]|nr:methyltransferase domain-containing protein [Acidobacteriota bacterium]
MYRYERPVQAGATTASTPEAWAANFASATKLNRLRRWRFAHSLETKLIRRHLPAGSKIIDAGCGFGDWVTFLNGLGYRAVGVDYSDELIQRLREAYPEGEWVQTDIRAMPYPEAAFDGIISWGVVEHDEAGPGAALREFHRLLRPEGVAIVTVPVDSAITRRACEVFEHEPGKEHAFFQYNLSREELRTEMTNAGFEVLEIGSMPVAHIAFVAPKFARRLRGQAFRFLNLAVHVLMSWMKRYHVMIYVVARKPSMR